MVKYKVMNFQEIIGIDISKKVIDTCIHSSQKVKQFPNSKNGISELLKWLRSNQTDFQSTLFVFEHTGMYSYLVTRTLSDKNYHYYRASGLEIKRSMGITRGKDDIVDARRIALYGHRRRDEIKPAKNIKHQIHQLKSLMGLKKKLIKQRASFKGTLREQKRIFKAKDFKTSFDVQEKMINYLSKQIKTIEIEIEKIIKADLDLDTNYKLITSIKGIGREMATNAIVYTDNFTKFDTWRKFASYCGIAPFPYLSGTSIKGRNKVSHLANKKIKSLIHMCAITAILHNPEMKRFYNKRTGQGKSKMSTINIIRNKLIARIFAVVKRQTPYVDILKFAA